jgi:uridine phosphorylase
MTQFPESELILNKDGSIFHLHLLPEDIAHTIVTVGDPDRVTQVAKHFDKIDIKKQNREFVTQTGWLGKKRITVISTGIGTDNIDIVINELDALVNIDFNTRAVKEQLTKLDIIRIGTTGSVQENTPIDSFLVSEFGIGLDNLMNFYHVTKSADELMIVEDLVDHFESRSELLLFPYCFKASTNLLELFSDFDKGMTATNCGFYGPQGRKLRIKLEEKSLIDILNTFRYEGKKITNLEMETAGIYGLSKALGHNAISLNLVVANRIDNLFSQNSETKMEELIKKVVAKIA